MRLAQHKLCNTQILQVMYAVESEPQIRGQCSCCRSGGRRPALLALDNGVLAAATLAPAAARAPVRTGTVTCLHWSPAGGRDCP